MATIKSNEDQTYLVNHNDLIPLINNEGTAAKSVTPHQLLKGSGIVTVSNTTLYDHADETEVGSIAYTIENLIPYGGTVYIAPGVYHLHSKPLKIPNNIRLIGSGKNSTTITQNNQTEHAIEVGSGVNFSDTSFSIENIEITTPESTSTADAINLIASQANNGVIRSVLITGGSQMSWGITNNGNNRTNYEDIYINGMCNGARWLNNNGNINFGDCYVFGLEVTLNQINTIGVYLSGTATSITNNISFDRIEVKTKYAPTARFSNTTGIYLADYVNRCLFKQADMENCATSILINSNCSDNTFINPQHIGHGMPLINNAYYGSNVFISGNPPFRQYETYIPKGKDIISLTENTIIEYETHAGKIINNTGAISGVSLSLPSADNNHSYEFEFYSTTEQQITIELQDNTDRIIGQNGSINSTISSSGLVNEYIKITNIDYKTWAITSVNGAWQ